MTLDSVTQPADDKESSFDWEKYEIIAHAIDLSLEKVAMTLPSDKRRRLARLTYLRFSDHPIVSSDEVQSFIVRMIDDLEDEAGLAEQEARAEEVVNGIDERTPY